MNPRKNEEFIPVHLYIEDWTYYTPPASSKKDEENDENDVERGVIILDIM